MTDDTKVIIEALDACGESGCGIISLALKTGISQESLRNFFKEQKKYCLPVEKHKFKLNRNTAENGSTSKIIINIEREKAEQKIKNRVSNGFFWGFMLGLISPNIGKWLRDFYAWLV